MKRIFVMLLAGIMLLTGISVFAEGEDGKVLTLYASTPEPYLSDMIRGFEELTGIKVELVSAGTSELYKKVVAEADAPVADILRGGMMWGSYVPIKEHLMEYVSPLNDLLPDDCKVIFDSIYGFSYVPSGLMINDTVLEELGVTVTGYADLLQPELKGMVTIPDPTQTSSGWEQVVNMLYAMGGGDTDEGWDYFDKLMANGLVINAGSSGTHKSVADGEYAVGLIAEGMATTYMEEGMAISLVWPVEGTVMNSDGIAAVKNCPHPESAKAFIDYLISLDYQNLMLTSSPQLRPVYPSDQLTEEFRLTPTEEIYKIYVDYEYLAANKDDMLERAKDIMTNYD